MAVIPPIPRFTIVLQAKGFVSKIWDDWFQALASGVDRSGQQVGRVSLDTQSASIGATSVQTGLAAGLYRVSYYQQVTRAATVTSSLTTQFTWTYNSTTQTTANAAMTGNALTTHQEATFPIRVDASSAVQYTTTYASSGATGMQFSLDIALEALPS